MNIEDIKKPENIVYKKTPILTDNVMHYCPGCSHGTVHKLVAEVIEEMGIQEETIAISPVGCSVFAYNYLNVDWQQAAHGRAPALATAAKRLNPEKYVFTYQGDGDLASIGTAEIIHASTFSTSGQSFLPKHCTLERFCISRRLEFVVTA